MKHNLHNTKKDDIVILTDHVSIKDNIITKKGAKGLELVVQSRRVIKHPENLYQIILLETKNETEQRYIVFKTVDTQRDIRVYQFNGWLNPGSRQELLNQGFQILFKEPVDSNSFIPDVLEWTDTINLNVGGIDATWSKKYPTLFGETTEHPYKKGIHYPILTGITEYKSGDPVDCNEIMILETGNYAEFLEGWNINESDLEILSV